jgi:hypothetical protein
MTRSAPRVASSSRAKRKSRPTARGGEVFYVACDFRKALSIYGEKFSYREVANYLRGPK